MTASPDRESNALRETQMLLVNRLCNQFEAEWQAGQRPALEELLKDLPTADRQAVLRDLLPLEVEYRQQAGETPGMDDYARRFPDADRDWLGSLFYSTRVASAGSDEITIPDRLGDYQILGRIGGGGMGAVYKALHVRMNRIVALKILRPDIQRDAHLLQRFEREVRAAARLTHPNIVTALDAREQDGLHYLITEYVDGLDLDEIVYRHGPLPMSDALDAILQAARGLEFAHSQGVIHRDIKPANLLRSPEGFVKVLDMGLARIEADPDTKATDLTNSGMVLGTVAYMAPEQARDVRRADARSDIYSLGCTLYYLVTGRPAFTGASPIDTLLSHLNEPTPKLTVADDAASVRLEQIFSRMIAKEPADRFQTATELVAELEKLQAYLPSSLDHSVTAQSGLPQFETPTQALQASTAMLEDTDFDPDEDEPRSWRTWLTAVVGLAGAIVIALALPFLMSPNGSQSHPAVGQYSLEFDGTSSYVAVPSLAPLAGGTYTLEVVVEPASTELGNVLAWMGPDWMGLYLHDRRWGMARRVGTASHLIVSDQLVEFSKRVHLAAVYRGPNLQLFVDGRLTDPHMTQFRLPETAPGLFIGGSPPDRLPEDQNRRYFAGRIHSVRISQGARYQSIFAPPQNLRPDSDTLALYHFHAGSGTVVKDASGHGHDGEIHNAKWYRN